MNSDKAFAATLLQNRLLNAAFIHGRETKRGFAEPFTTQEVRSCKVGLKLIRKGHFRLANGILKKHCPEMQKAVFE